MKPAALREAIVSAAGHVVETDFYGDVVQHEPTFHFDARARERVVRLEDRLRELPPYECPVAHYFVDGLYVREIFIPAGCALVGYIHTQPCITTLTLGTIVIGEGGEARTFRAPMTMTCAAGSKKAGYALTDVRWQDAYLNPDNEHDIERLEARLTANTHEEFLLRRNEQLRLGVTP